MKIIHLSDLHLGKRVNEFSMLPDQEHILDQILSVIADESPDAVIIAGDVYDRSAPPAEAVRLFDGFLCALAEMKLQVFVISGNHDSPERIAFGGRLMEGSGIHLSPVYSGHIDPVVLHDSFGAVSFYMLPFVRPLSVRRFFPDTEISSYTDAVIAAVDEMGADFTQRNVIIAHQFVTGAASCESEEISVGGLDNVGQSAFDGFDYAALGHIHNPQNIGSERVRYCGTPLKYSFSEASHEKSVTVAELGEKGDLTVRTVPLVPLHDMKVIRGSFDDVYSSEKCEDYVHIVLTDEEDVPEALSRLRPVFPNIMKLTYDNTRTRTDSGIAALENAERKTPMELLREFYEQRNNKPMSPEQEEFALGLIRSIWEVDV
ncbi:MAG: exonuclease SbcCD subunit D [Ruminococcus sp.]|nr:exonuclease SbcCD subunit D [Ruminococcus sp.]